MWRDLWSSLDGWVTLVVVALVVGSLALVVVRFGPW